MSTKPNTPVVTPKSVLSTLSEVGGYVGLAIQVGDLLVPIGKALVQKIEQIGKGGPTITYQLLLSQDQAELNDVDALSTADLTAINAELTRLGAAPLPVPSSGSGGGTITQ